MVLVMAVEGIDGGEVGVVGLFFVPGGGEEAGDDAEGDGGGEGGEELFGLEEPGEQVGMPGEVVLVGGDAVPDAALEFPGGGVLHLPEREQIVERVFRRIHGGWRG